ncbi:cysteine proteinase inhibitor 8-like [Wolffia australiana]
MRSSCSALGLCLVFFAAAAAIGGSALVGGFSKINDVKDPHVVEIGKFAVTANNKATGGKLVFIRVVSGRQQVVAGMNYDLVIEAKSGGVTRRYAALVYERAWDNYRKLSSFKPVS